MKPQLHAIGLRYFVEVARSGSLKGASDILHVDVSALSRQITKLEKTLQCTLFERLPQGMILSAAGRQFQIYAERSLLDAEQITGALLDIDQLRSGTLRLACSQGFAYGLVPDLITRFIQTWPGVDIQLFVGSPGKVSQRVRHGEADIGLTFSLSPEPGIHVEQAGAAPVYALLRHDDALAGRNTLALHDLHERRVVLPEVGTTLRDLFDIAASQHDTRFRMVLESNHHDTLYQVAKASGAVLFTALLSVDRRFRQDGFVAVPLSDDALHRRSYQVQTMAGRTLPNGVRTFCDHIKTTLLQATGLHN